MNVWICPDRTEHIQNEHDSSIWIPIDELDDEAGTK